MPIKPRVDTQGRRVVSIAQLYESELYAIDQLLTELSIPERDLTTRQRVRLLIERYLECRNVVLRLRQLAVELSGPETT